MVTVSPSSVDFSVSFEGDALNEGVIDVRDLASSLISLGEVFTRANDLLNEEQTTVRLGVRATQRGSFEVQLVLNQVAAAATGFVLSAGPLLTATGLMQLVVGRQVSLLGVLKFLKGRKPERIESSEGVYFRADNIELHIPPDVLRLWEQPGILRSAAGIVEPLVRGAVERMVIKQEDQEIESIDQSEAQYIRTTREGLEVVNEYIIQAAVLKLIAPRFTKGRWQLHDGSSTKWYAIEDSRFRREIEQGRAFQSGDVLVGRVRVTQLRDDQNKLTQEQAVEEVIEHRQSLDQVGGDSNQLSMF